MSNTSCKIILGHNETENDQYHNTYCMFISFIKKVKLHSVKYRRVTTSVHTYAYRIRPGLWIRISVQ